MAHRHKLPRISLLLLALIAPLLLAYPASAAPDRRMLTGVPPTPQLWSLSCEYAATSAATAYYGSRVPQQTLRAAIAANANPHKGFRGDITGAWGGTDDYGIYAEPIASVLKQHGFAQVHVFYGGTDTLKEEIAANHPVIAWITGDYSTRKRTTLHDSAGSFSVVPREHAVTVYGYDTSGVWVIDPADTAETHVSWTTFEQGWSQLDEMALAIAP